MIPRDRFIGAGPSRIYVRDAGHGPPIIVLHGGPDFGHGYLLPELDRLAARFHLVYYDQRGRGRSFSPDESYDASMDTEVADLDRVRAFFGLARTALLGHSWGGVLAMEYATRYPGRVSHLILLNTAPPSHADNLVVRRELRRRRSVEHAARLTAMASDRAYLSGDPEADADFYRVHFAAGVRDPVLLERLVSRLRPGATSDGVLAARAIEQRLYAQTWDERDYDLLPALSRAAPPTLVLHGEDDFVPLEVPSRIAAAVRGSRLVILRNCGHFCFIEQPDGVMRAVCEAWAPNP